MYRPYYQKAVIRLSCWGKTQKPIGLEGLYDDRWRANINCTFWCALVSESIFYVFTIWVAFDNIWQVLNEWSSTDWIVFICPAPSTPEPADVTELHILVAVGGFTCSCSWRSLWACREIWGLLWWWRRICDVLTVFSITRFRCSSTRSHSFWVWISLCLTESFC